MSEGGGGWKVALLVAPVVKGAITIWQANKVAVEMKMRRRPGAIVFDGSLGTEKTAKMLARLLGKELPGIKAPDESIEDIINRPDISCATLIISQSSRRLAEYLLGNQEKIVAHKIAQVTEPKKGLFWPGRAIIAHYRRSPGSSSLYRLDGFYL